MSEQKWGTCRTPHHLGEPTSDRKALMQNEHTESAMCSDWRESAQASSVTCEKCGKPKWLPTSTIASGAAQNAQQFYCACGEVFNASVGQPEASPKHEKWCASIPREMDAPMGRGPYKCDCGAARQPKAGEPRIIGIDLGNGPDRAVYVCPTCGSSEKPCKHYDTGAAPVEELSAEQFWRDGDYPQRLVGKEVFEFAEAYALAVRQEAERGIKVFQEDADRYRRLGNEWAEMCQKLTAERDALSTKLAAEKVEVSQWQEIAEQRAQTTAKYESALREAREGLQDLYDEFHLSGVCEDHTCRHRMCTAAWKAYHRAEAILALKAEDRK